MQSAEQMGVAREAGTAAAPTIDHRIQTPIRRPGFGSRVEIVVGCAIGDARMRASGGARCGDMVRFGGWRRRDGAPALWSFSSECRYAGRGCESPGTARRRPAGRTDQPVRAVAFVAGGFTPPAGSGAISSRTMVPDWNTAMLGAYAGLLLAAWTGGRRIR